MIVKNVKKYQPAIIGNHPSIYKCPNVIRSIIIKNREIRGEWKWKTTLDINMMRLIKNMQINIS